MHHAFNFRLSLILGKILRNWQLSIETNSHSVKTHFCAKRTLQNFSSREINFADV